MNQQTSNDLKNQVLWEAKRVSEMGLTPLTQGNFSLRDPNSGLIFITPHDYPYELMTANDILVVDVHGNIIEGERIPSYETPVHCAVYRARPEVNGIVHTEPVWANCFGALNMPIEPIFVNMIADVGGSVPVMPFAMSGNPEFGECMLQVMGSRNAVIWANHGLLTVGKTLAQAVHCTVMVETAAKIYHLALQLGKPSRIPQEVIDRIVG